ncbi:uncharacterized protein BP01DRAFT_419415 [Aspergillus saccharolyticus JOP 1030-1]|uniref:DUF7702 domain-containing protein n=1 Tax=Aspergillus saccharolyticus JOP 1030-1 TaxID=1450539 RepID=A0A318ZJQ8_9EURO|nr:hypothetical protein BP01DRAFT_419415 [Aspergillus saccharolyticus JOP 1030-1]PYH40498.1 hypothetical protein BP01DRAFT_419415 [Aspergillus saccharolyticus JOP 1030-1]
MAVDYRHGISILELIVYIPTLFTALWMAFRHGFTRSSGWIFFVIFSLARIIGSCCYLATINDPTSIDLYVAWAVCTSIGISPLTWGCIGLLSRANDSIQRKSGHALHPLLFKVTGLVTIVGMILGIVGQTTSTNPTEGLYSSKTKAGLILYIIAWVGLCILLLLISLRYQRIEEGEHRLLLAVSISIPLLFVRILYSLLSTFTRKAEFSSISGNVSIQLCMSVLEELVIVYVCLGIGLTLTVRPAFEPFQANIQDASTLESQPDMSSMQYESGKPGARYKKRRGGPITQLVGLAMDEINYRRQK